ncbi:MAG TPA: Rieske 2Fe-2S domain-containing protein [Nitrososphaera sp.]|nr:Rieske 2Fe-2S domain-containing protein [Nitrososphaera sp.]
MPTFQKVANIKDLKESKLLRVDIEDKPIVLAMVQENVYAMDAVCSHEGGPLEDGSLEGHELKCPWHYALFDVRNAKVSEQTVWATDLQSYSVKVEESSGDIMVSPQPKSPETTIETERSTPAPKEAEEQTASSYSSLTLTAKQKVEGTDIMTFKFTNDGYPEYKAGQFAFFPLDNVNNDSRGPVRHFSLTSSPTEDTLIISTRIRDTPYKQRLSTLQDGEQVKVSKPQGNFVLHDDYSKPAIFLSGGIGVTPFRSMIKYATDNQLPIKITMFDSNRNQQNILYKDEFDKWAAQNQNLKIVYTITEEEKDTEQQQHRMADVSNNATETKGDWNGERGRIDRTMIERHLSKEEISNAIFYICGPPGMIKALEGLLQKQFQIQQGRIKVEEFTGY